MTQQLLSLEEQYDLGCFPSESRPLLELAERTSPRCDVGLGLIAERISETAEVIGCEVRINMVACQESVRELDVKALACFVVTFLSSARRVSPTRLADVTLLWENGYCTVQISFDAAEWDSGADAVLNAFADFAFRLKMRFDWRRENGVLTVSFMPAAKDWALLEVKSPSDDGDELLVID